MLHFNIHTFSTMQQYNIVQKKKKATAEIKVPIPFQKKGYSPTLPSTFIERNESLSRIQRQFAIYSRSIAKEEERRNEGRSCFTRMSPDNAKGSLERIWLALCPSVDSLSGASTPSRLLHLAPLNIVRLKSAVVN